MGGSAQATWLLGVRELLARGQREDALALLEARSTAHAGTPKAADKRAAFGAVLDALGADRRELWRWTQELAGAESPTRRELACLLLAELYPDHRTQVRRRMPPLAGDGHWEVRLWAGDLFATLLGRSFDELYPVYREWAAHPSQFVRVAVVTSVRDQAHRRHPERARPLLELLEPLLADRAHEVERNLGGFAIGGGLLRFFPDETLAAVRRWARSDDEQVRWNVAMVFAAAEGRKHLDVGLEVLSELARDGRKKVWQAVSSALRNLVNGDPDRVVPVLERWLSDERKLPAALALRGR